jgi:hypothetical protein
MEIIYNFSQKYDTEVVFHLWVLPIMLISIQYSVWEAGCALLFRQRKAPNLVDPLDKYILCQ